MIGQTWRSEMLTFEDEKTGRTIRKLTSVGNNVHLYFTENSFDAHRNEIIFRSDRASGQDKAPDDALLYNLFRMDLNTGEIVQLTDEKSPVGNVTKTPDSRIVVYSTGNKMRKLDTESGEVSTVYEETGKFKLGAPSIGADRRYIAFSRNEAVAVPRGPNYAGFKDHYYLVKDGRITLAYLDGARPGRAGWFDVFRDTHWLSHFQFCPDDPTLATFCHEGPWHLVTQRIWLLDFVSREAWPCFRQGEQDSIGHEFWTQDGYVFFDDRGPGHDGTITSSRTQAVATEVAVKSLEGPAEASGTGASSGHNNPFCRAGRQEGEPGQAHRHALLLQPLPRQPRQHRARRRRCGRPGAHRHLLRRGEAASSVQPQDLVAHPVQPLPSHLELGRNAHPVRL